MDSSIKNYQGLIPIISDIKKRITILGASGFLGHAMCARYQQIGETNILAVARNESELVKLKERFPFVTIMVGDISDWFVVEAAMANADEVILAAAMKHVGLSETDVQSCVKTNVIGAMNVINVSRITKPKVLVFTSTDKAGQPNGVYGCSKKIAERLMIEAEKVNTDTKYRVVRYPNVFGSSGSFITKWKPKMERGEEIILTDPEASRFFFTIDDAVNLIFESINEAKDASPLMPHGIKAIKMGTVLEACMDVYGKCPVKIIGLQTGENKVETTDGIVFSDQCEQYSKDEFIKKFLLV